jgi:hypothetical protein
VKALKKLSTLLGGKAWWMVSLLVLVVLVLAIVAIVHGAADRAATRSFKASRENVGSLTMACDYYPARFTRSRQGLRYVVDVTIQNASGVGTIERVTATWVQGRAVPVASTRVVRVLPHQKRVIHFARVHRPDLHQALDGQCSVTSKTVGSFVAAH